MNKDRTTEPPIPDESETLRETLPVDEEEVEEAQRTLEQLNDSPHHTPSTDETPTDRPEEARR